MRLVLDHQDLQQLPITIEPNIVSGTSVFSQTRVPFKALISNLEDGMSLGEFLDNFPSISRERLSRRLKDSAQRVLPR